MKVMQETECKFRLYQKNNRRGGVVAERSPRMRDIIFVR